MKKVRIIPRLDVKGPNVVKGIQLEGLRVVGNPSELARRYYQQGADELIYIDIVASLYNRNNLAHIVEETTQRGVFIPITVGGGIRTLEDISCLLRCGADKVAINTAAVKNPEFLREASRVFGSSTIVLSVEAKKMAEGKWEAYTDNGREKTGLDVVEWVQKAVQLGVGEILLTSVDREGTRQGYDMDLIDAVTAVLSVPVVVSGGAGQLRHVERCLENKKIDGIALASLFHYGDWKIHELKNELSKKYAEKINQVHAYDLGPQENLAVDVSIVDYNLGNLRSVRNTFTQLGAKPKFVKIPEEILNSEFLVLPGVGAFGEGMQHLRDRKLDEAIIKYAQSGRPLLGICLGSQLLMSKSYEFGEHHGLGLIEGEVVRFEDSESLRLQGYKVPHVGWNSIDPALDWSGTIFKGVLSGVGAYFVHSFFAKPALAENILAVTNYFGNNFCSVVRKGNIYGCQFHPEKSGPMGLSLLKEFLRISKKIEACHVC